MQVRPVEKEDAKQLEILYAGPVPALNYERVLVEDGKIVGHAGVRMVPECVLALAKGHPAARMHWLRTLQGEFLRWMNETGHKRIFALVPPNIYRGYLRRLQAMGWKEGYQSVIFLAGVEDEWQ